MLARLPRLWRGCPYLRAANRVSDTEHGFDPAQFAASSNILEGVAKNIHAGFLTSVGRD
jgi:hypothetical protein